MSPKLCDLCGGFVDFDEFCESADVKEGHDFLCGCERCDDCGEVYLHGRQGRTCACDDEEE